MVLRFYGELPGIVRDLRGNCCGLPGIAGVCPELLGFVRNFPPHSQGVVFEGIDNQCIVKNREGFGYLRKYPNPSVVFVNC